MVEHTSAPLRHVDGIGAGPFVIAITFEGERAEAEHRLTRAGAVIESRTAHTSYARDPEGNRIALSDYPSP